MADSLPLMMAKVLMKEEGEYIENTLKACSEDLKIATYTVIRETSWDEMKKQVDAIVEHNPLMELATTPLNMNFLGADKWVAVLVEYEDQ